MLLVCCMPDAGGVAACGREFRLKRPPLSTRAHSLNRTGCVLAILVKRLDLQLRGPAHVPTFPPHLEGHAVTAKAWRAEELARRLACNSATADTSPSFLSPLVSDTRIQVQMSVPGAPR